MKTYTVRFLFEDKINDCSYFDNEALEKIGIYHNFNCDRVVARNCDDAINRLITLINDCFTSKGYFILHDECDDYHVFDNIDSYNFACENQDFSKSIYFIGFFKSEEVI